MMAKKGKVWLWPWIGGAIIGASLATYWLLTRPPGPEKWPDVRFEDITARAGIVFTHENGATARKLLPESMGSGVAVFDFDGDGRQDLLFVNSRVWPGERGKRATLALYRNQGGGEFKEVTGETGLDLELFGMGVAVGDYDNDGWPDVFITAVGGNRLFRNDGGKRFIDATARARVGGPGAWSASAAWLDYDGDGRLDLFVCNYLSWSPELDDKSGARLRTGERAYAPPRAFAGAQCFLYRNRGDGAFDDVSALVAVKEPLGKSLGVAVGDFDGDGWPDLAVANDTERNFLFRNVGGTRFEEIGRPAGVAFSDRRPRGAMGIDWVPSLRDGKGAIAIGNFADEPNTLLVRRGDSFVDLAVPEGIAAPSRPLLKFGLFFLDYDLDGRLDLLTCNGHLEPDIAKADSSQAHLQPVQLFRQRHKGFALATEKDIGPDLLKPLAGRGCAFGDLDGDGVPDVVLTANGGPARVLRCVNRTGNRWLRLRLAGDGRRSNTSAIGARVELEAGGRVQKREVQGARGYLSSSELVLTFGL
ncbi:MAG: CRTAC1 family protein, partial [Gemmataceae bacterium]|nr:CRTAC1 family protein [Gemmataceae bacterium]